MDKDLLTKILTADISRETKEKILSYWLLPNQKVEGATTPIQKTEEDERVGIIKRPSKKDIDLKKNPKKKEEEEAMTETLDEALKDKNE